MDFSIDDALKLLRQTPATLFSLLKNLPQKFISQNEGGDSWRPIDVIRHLIQGEELDWIFRVKFILEHGTAKPFVHKHISARFEGLKEKNLAELLEMFEQLREKNLKELQRLNLASDQLQIKGAHPAFKHITVKQVLAAWVVHDLNHIYQISRVMAKQYDQEVGPFKPYISILNR